MLRKSFLRGHDLETVSPGIIWDLPGIKPRQIGFSICKESGLIMQSPSPTSAEIEDYYKNTATYINPGRNGKPSLAKEKNVSRVINLCRELISKIPESAFQVGCSDGYTLSKFAEEGIKLVDGIDPSEASSILAKKLYNLNTKVGCFENFRTGDKKFELLILTHVLEHLFDPLNVLLKCNKMQNYGDHLLLEVPLFENEGYFPPGLLTVEHLNYFSEGTIIEAVTRANYSPVFIGKYFSLNQYPVITVVARKTKSIAVLESKDYIRNLKTFHAYLDIEKKNWSIINKTLASRIQKGDAGYIFGAGAHTSQLLAFTEIKDLFSIKGILDNSPTKWGKKIGRYPCFDLEKIHLDRNDKIIISSYASENEIYKNLSKKLKNEIVCLYMNER